MIIKRKIYPEIKKVIDSPEAVIITGMRRVGKTTLLQYILQNIKSENKIYLDLENPINQKYFEEENYENILDNFEILGLDVKKQAFVFLDEIQFVKNIPSAVKYLMDHYKIKFFLSGSASFYLKNLFTELLAGRKYIFELFPFSFDEFLQIKNKRIDLKKMKSKISETIYKQINGYYDEYILYGGFPGVAQKETIKEKEMALDDIFTSYFQMEVKQLGDFRKIKIIRDLMLLLLERTGSKLDIQKLAKELGVARETIYDYVGFLESTYFIKLIRPFSRNKDSEIRSMPKFYVCDSGLASRFAQISKGALFENSVFLALRDKGEVNYYQKKSGVEIDFILDKKRAYEVKISPDKRDLNKLRLLAKELKLRDYKIISKKYTDLNNVIYGFAL